MYLDLGTRKYLNWGVRKYLDMEPLHAPVQEDEAA